MESVLMADAQGGQQSGGQGQQDQNAKRDELEAAVRRLNKWSSGAGRG
ncbi:hypothetical protein SAZ11_25840 [Streptomyces sp. FXJ1.4098]|nr:hypothetical protein [Streptomyces sp. FXJ1.4098]